MSGDLDVPRSTCHHARHLATTAMEEDIRRTQQQSVPPQVPQVGRAGGETGASPSIRRPMLVASVVEAKKPSRGILQWLAPSLMMQMPDCDARKGQRCQAAGSSPTRDLGT